MKPIDVLQKLIQFNTVNLPGNEKPCIDYIESLMISSGLETKQYALDPNRPNLWVTHRSKKPTKQPFLMYGHVDVVPVEGQDWDYDPFGGIIEDGMIYGRGTVDMKGPLSLFICTMMHLSTKELDYDVHLLVLSDEENHGTYGAQFMVKHHPELFEDIHYAFGEIGGFSIDLVGKTFYPIMVAEKQVAHIKLEFMAQGGHASMKQNNTSMEKMARGVEALQNHRLKTRITKPTQLMIEAMAKPLGMKGLLLKQLLQPNLTNTILDLLHEQGSLFDPLLHHNLNLTIVHGGTNVNVMPSIVSVEGDLRILPGSDINEALQDIHDVLRKHAKLSQDDYRLEVLAYDQNLAQVDMHHFDLLKQTINHFDPNGYVIPFVLAAVTDGRFLSQVGIQTYGFTPLKLPKGYDFTTQAHNKNESLPVDALDFGLEALCHFFEKEYKG